MNFDLSDEDSFVDWTHEREWRLPGNLAFSLDDCFVLLSRSCDYEEFLTLCNEDEGPRILEEVKGIVTLEPILF